MCWGAAVMMTTMLSSAAHALSEDMVEYAGRAALPTPDADFMGLGALYRLYPAADGWVPFLTCICPFRIICMTSMPDKMMRAHRKSLKPCIGFVMRLMAR